MLPGLRSYVVNLLLELGIPEDEVETTCDAIMAPVLFGGSARIEGLDFKLHVRQFKGTLPWWWACWLRLTKPK